MTVKFHAFVFRRYNHSDYYVAKESTYNLLNI